MYNQPCILPTISRIVLTISSSFFPLEMRHVTVARISFPSPIFKVTMTASLQSVPSDVRQGNEKVGE